MLLNKSFATADCYGLAWLLNKGGASNNPIKSFETPPTLPPASPLLEGPASMVSRSRSPPASAGFSFGLSAYF